MTKKIHNFNAGPSILPDSVLKITAQAVLNLNNSGLSLIEISHRSKDWEKIHNECIALWKELLNIPDGYSVLFLGNGASGQFGMVPYNLLNKKALYIETGVWAKKAIKEAKLFGEVEIIASSSDKNFNYYPSLPVIDSSADYLHITTNNTIYGTESFTDISSPVPLIADMSSDILSRPVDVSKYGLIYGGAQKNAGTAGVTFVIIKNDILGKVNRQIPSMLDYRLHIQENSLYNTPPVFGIFVMCETLKWIKSLGGVSVIQKMNTEKAKILYDYLDQSKIFIGTAEKHSRSIMNICFVMKEGYQNLEETFLQFAKENGMIGIKGHRLVGGFRASCYNALPKSSVETLVQCMEQFEKQYTH